jgi:hypothetical protein
MDQDIFKTHIMLIIDITMMMTLMKLTIERKADLLDNKAMSITIEMSFQVFDNTDDYIYNLNKTNSLSY